jgi:Protein of unknown function (DUF3800)
MIIQGYLDDSGSHAASPIYVLGGIMSDANTFATFTDDWQDTLAKQPWPIDLLHMKDANSFCGQFQACPPNLRDQKVFELAELLPKYKLRRVEASMLQSDYDELLKGQFPGPVCESPYFLCFYKLVTAFAREPSLKGKSIQLIFDEQGRIGEDARAAYTVLREMYPEEYKMISRPIFGSDVDYKPLQAADLYAWHARRHMLDELIGDERKRFHHIHQLLNKLEYLGLPIHRSELVELAANFKSIEANGVS